MMNLLREAAAETISRLPEKCSLEDIMYRIDMVAQVLEGAEDAEAGRLITTEELLERVEQWAK
jgi:predicted transcriptional regulator